MRELLEKGLRSAGVLPDAEMLKRFLLYAELLTEGGKSANLTAITDPKEIITRHFIDSAGLLSCRNFRGKSVIDVGSGAGFPGLPLKIIMPDIALTLLDASRKKAEFTERVAKEIGLEVSCLHGRAEVLAREAGYRGSFDFAVSRAVSELRVLSELTLPFVRLGGELLAMKARDCEDEIEAAGKALKLLGGGAAEKLDYPLFGHEGRINSVVIIKKICKTPEKYPRRFAKIKSDPL